MVHNVKNFQSPNGTNPYKRCHNSSKTAYTGTLFIMYERRKRCMEQDNRSQMTII